MIRCSKLEPSPFLRYEVFLTRLIKGLKKIRGINILLIGGPDEDERNRVLANVHDVLYFGTFDYIQFISIVNLCDVVITPVTLALHVAIGLKKKVILLNNVFNRHEFYFYGNGRIFEPNIDCLGCYKNAFDSDCPVGDCTELYDVDAILEEVLGT